MVDAHVVERAAGRVLFLDEGGRAVAVDVGAAAPAVAHGARVVDAAQLAAVDEKPGGLGLALEHGEELDGEAAAGGLGRVEHAPGVDVGAGHGLLAEDVLARLERGDGHGRVVVVVQADVDGVDVVAGEQVAEVGVDVGDGVQPGHAARLRLVDVGDGDDLDVGHLGVGLDVAFADLADADDADFHPIYI